MTTAPAPGRTRTTRSRSAADKYLTFVLGSEHYALPILKVQEIIGLLDITQAMLRWMAPFLSFTAEEAYAVFSPGKKTGRKEGMVRHQSDAPSRSNHPPKKHEKKKPDQPVRLKCFCAALPQ